MFLQKVPNLCCLTVKSLSMFMDGYQWENIINNDLPKLKIFRCTMAIYWIGLEKLKELVNDHLRSFQSQFWLEKDQWFIQCHLKSDIQGRYYILYYTLPYFSISSMALSDCLWSASTCPYENDYWLSKSVHDSFIKIYSPIKLSNSDNLDTIDYGKRIMNIFRLNFNGREDLKQTALSPSFDIARQISNLTNTSEVHVRLPFDKHFSKFIPQLDQLTSLDVQLTADYTNQSDLRILLKQTPNLHSLHITDSSKTTLKYFLVDLKYLSNHHLNLPKVVSLTDGIFFNLQQCTELSHSPLNKQCEVLTINVQNKECIIELINKMTNLRLLMVQSYEEQYVYSFSSRRRCPDLVVWLKSTLPFTIKVADYDCCEAFVKLWIR
ncbi:hypothetical protein I4U23_005546 [Adineta vaga]|nr:hypothetical protein I4U23_005546 [Adineta vaga]